MKEAGRTLTSTMGIKFKVASLKVEPTSPETGQNYIANIL
jgi:hypothetical protein